MFLCLKIFIQADDVLVSCLLQNRNFLHHFFWLTFFFKMSCIYWFYRDKLFCHNLQCNINLSKSPFAQNLTDSVELNSSSRTLPVFAKGFFNMVYQFLMHLFSWCKTTIKRSLSFNLFRTNFLFEHQISFNHTIFGSI